MRNRSAMLSLLLAAALSLPLAADVSPAVSASEKSGRETALSATPPAGQTASSREVMPDTWVFTDGLGRKSLTHADVGDPKEDKTVAMFYWTWHTDLSSGGALNTTEFMKKHPDARNNYHHPAWKGTPRYCFWNEPIYGFYRSDDEWVLRRQAELLANAGVDAIFADNTNGSFTWKNGYTPLFQTFDEAKKAGVPVPAISFMLPFGPDGGHDGQVRSLYQDIYKPGRFSDLWFRFDGKPMLMAYENHFKDSQNERDREIHDFFTWRAGQPVYDARITGPRQWGWLSIYPQALYSPKGYAGIKRGLLEQTTVGVAMNHNYITHEITAMNGEHVMGRSYTSDYPDRFEKEGEEASLWGYNFSEQFDYALEKNPPVIFVTGWNEWHAWRQPNPWGGAHSQVNNALVDQFDNEHSRDIEPTKGELKDHYYYLLVNYVRRYKGCRPIPTPGLQKTMDIRKDESQWQDVEPFYAAYAGNTADRNHAGYGKLSYQETSGRNDIIGSRVARDEDYVYFYVECADPITPHTDPLWMNLYIDCDPDNQGWETFDYILNKKSPTDTHMYLEKFTGRKYSTTSVGEVPYTVNGRYLQVAIPKSLLNLDGHDFTINFTWTDHVHDEGKDRLFSGDIMDFYISGDVAPGGRFKYSYVSTRANATGEEETTSPVTEAPTEPLTEAPTEPATESPTEPTPETAGETAPGTNPADPPAGTKAEESGTGCASLIGPIPLPVMAAVPAVGAFLLRKSRKKPRRK